MLQAIFNTYKNSFSGLGRQTWLLSIVIMFNRCGSMAVPFMGLYVTQSLKRTEMDAGIIITLFGIGSILGAAVGGKLTDVIGFRPVQIISSIISGILFIMFAYVDNFQSLCVLTVVISFFSDAFRPANFTAIAHYAKPGTLTRSYSLNRLATNIGWSAGITLGGIIASINYKLLFVVEGMVAILVGIFIILLLPKAKSILQQAQENREVKDVSKPWHDQFYMQFIVLTTLFITCSFLIFRVVPVFFKEQWHLNESQIGLIIGINGALIALFEMVLINKIEKKRPPMFFIIIGAIFFSVSYLLLSLPVIFHVLVAIISITIFTIGEMFVLPFINTIVISRSNDHNRGLYAAGYTLSWSVAQVIGPMMGFFIAKHYGYNTLWFGIACVILICAYGFSLLQKHNR